VYNRIDLEKKYVHGALETTFFDMSLKRIDNTIAFALFFNTKDCFQRIQIPDLLKINANAVKTLI